MTHFLNNTFGQAVGHIHNLSNAATAIEIRCGKYNLLLKHRIAEGGFGFVDLVTDIHTETDYVLKRCNIDRPESMATVKKEINILQRFKSQHIVELLDSDIHTLKSNQREALLLLAFCPGGHLLDRLNSRNGKLLPPESIYRIFAQIVKGVALLHRNDPPVSHRDLKLENILFGTDGIAKLCDFGSCVEGCVYIRNTDERNNAAEIISKETTQMYRAPEMVDLYMRPVLTEKTDIWALGCIFYTLCFLSHPFQVLGALSAKVNFPSKSSVTEDAHTLILRMLDMDPEARLTADQILDGLRALASGNTLPQNLLELTPEAQICRTARLAADVARDNKQKQQQQKKVAAAHSLHPVPPRPAAANAPMLQANSVAAKRLAAKRGQVIDTTTNSQAANFSPDFGSVNHSEEPPFIPDFGDSHTAAISSDFDPFGSSFPFEETAATISSTARTLTTAFDPFGESETTTTAPPAATRFATAAAAAAPLGSADSLFDNFKDSQWASPSANNDPFFPSLFAVQNSSGEQGFSAFDNDEPGTFAPSAISAAAAPLASADSLFSNFEDNFDATLPASSASAQISSGFSEFDDHDIGAAVTSTSNISAAAPNVVKPAKPPKRQSAASLLFASLEEPEEDNNNNADTGSRDMGAIGAVPVPAQAVPFADDLVPFFNPFPSSSQPLDSSTSAAAMTVDLFGPSSAPAASVSAAPVSLLDIFDSDAVLVPNTPVTDTSYSGSNKSGSHSRDGSIHDKVLSLFSAPAADLTAGSSSSSSTGSSGGGGGARSEPAMLGAGMRQPPSMAFMPHAMPPPQPQVAVSGGMMMSSGHGAVYSGTGGGGVGPSMRAMGARPAMSRGGGNGLHVMGGAGDQGDAALMQSPPPTQLLQQQMIKMQQQQQRHYQSPSGGAMMAMRSPPTAMTMNPSIGGGIGAMGGSSSGSMGAMSGGGGGMNHGSKPSVFGAMGNSGHHGYGAMPPTTAMAGGRTAVPLTRATSAPQYSTQPPTDPFGSIDLLNRINNTRK